MSKIAFICLGAYNVDSWTKEQNFVRQSVYSIALEQALTLAELQETKDKDLDLTFFVVENTVTNKDTDVIPEFREQFTNPRIADVMFINNNDLGAKNKGAGEYTMCRAVIEKHKDLLATYDWVIYYTLRQIIVAPLVLKTIAELQAAKSTSPIVVANPSSLYQDDKEVFPPAGNYCDMIFAMKPEAFFAYISSMSPEELARKKMSSEKNLSDFVHTYSESTGLEATERKRLGVLRYDYAINKTEIS